MANFALHLFGTFTAIVDGREVSNFATDKARALLAYLAVESDRSHRRDALAGLLWPDLPQARARQSLRQTLSRIRRAVDQHAHSPPLLLVDQDRIRLRADGDVWLDVAAFMTLVAESDSHSHRAVGACRRCLERLECAAALYRGDFLDQFFLPDAAPFEEWALLKRDRLRQQAMAACEILATHYERRTDYAKAKTYAWQQIELEPWCEEAHRQLMRVLALTGKRSAALAQYESCRRTLAETLGVEPSRTTYQLYARIRAGVDVEPPPPHNLPAAPTPFVGREKELVDLCDLLADPDVRLVTLVGPGGIGKTRLALQVAADHVGTAEHGVYAVHLADTREVDAAVLALADALGVILVGHTTPRQQLLAHLRDKDVLLLLDNLEHLSDADTLVDAILRNAPRVRLLATSRRRLNLREERVYHLVGLRYPETDSAHFVKEQHSAVTLFLHAAQRANRHFALGARDLPEVVRICRLVDGSPLGLELAAAAADTNSCADIARDIAISSDALATTLHNIDPRHRSLRASFEYSWTLLTDAERTCLARLAVFQGGFDLGAAFQVVGASTALLSRIAHASLLHTDSQGRYHLHPLLHQYITEKLDATAEADTLSLQHSRYYARFLGDREAALRSADQVRAQHDIALEIDNIRQALRWALARLSEGRHVQPAMEILDTGIETLHLYYLLRDWYQEGDVLFGNIADVLEARLTDEVDPSPGRRLLARALTRQGRCCEFTVFTDRAQTLYMKSIAILQSLPQSHGEIALSLNGLGYMAMIKGRYQRARTLFDDSLARYRQAGDAWGTASVLSNLCLLLRRTGDFEGGERAGLESLMIRRAIGDLRGIAASLNNLGLMACSVGNHAEAERRFRESLQICRKMRYRVGISSALNGLCQATFFQGDRGAAERYAQESLDLCRDLGDQWGVAVALNNLGCIALAQEAYAWARDCFLEGIRVYREYDINSGLGNTINNLAEAYYHLGKLDDARTALHEALTITHASGNMPVLIEVIVGLTRLAASDHNAARGLEWLCAVLDHPSMLDEVRRKAQTLHADLSTRLDRTTVAEIERRAYGRDLESIIAEIMST